jgi:hypothetical protein
MSQISPLLTSLAQTTQVEMLQTEEVTRNLRKEELLREDAASVHNEDPEAVENTDAIVEIHDQPSQPQEQKKSKHHHHAEQSGSSPEGNHIDLTA